jgi:uncharacterized protein
MSCPQAPYRFVVERPLGRLAKWLRLLGFDTLYDTQGYFDTAVIGETQDRIRLTRSPSQKDFESEKDLIYISFDNVFLQLKQLVGLLGLGETDLHLFSRCLRCNIIIVGIDKSEALGQVPDYIWETKKCFNRCVGCGRIYWSGSHDQRVRARIADLFA